MESTASSTDNSSTISLSRFDEHLMNLWYNAFCDFFSSSAYTQIFTDAGVVSIEHADFDGIERLAAVTGGEIASTFDKCVCIINVIFSTNDVINVFLQAWVSDSWRMWIDRRDYGGRRPLDPILWLQVGICVHNYTPRCLFTSAGWGEISQWTQNIFEYPIILTFTVPFILNLGWAISARCSLCSFRNGEGDPCDLRWGLHGNAYGKCDRLAGVHHFFFFRTIIYYGWLFIRCPQLRARRLWQWKLSPALCGSYLRLLLTTLATIPRN